MYDRHHAFERPIQPEGTRTQQDIADVSRDAGYGNQLLPLSDLITLVDQPPQLARTSG
jgi:hypothetical protein